MELKEFKEKTQSKVVNIIARLGVFTLSEIMDIEDVREAKKNFDELSDLINEYIKDYEKPKFKVGDYVTIHDDLYDEKNITKIDEMEKTKAFGFWYKTEEKIVKKDYWFIGGEDSEHATQEEIAEYKAALIFHEHGRKPFEVKKDDIYLSNDGYKFFVDDRNFLDKDDFVSGNYTLLKTAEEVEAWLSDGKTDIG